MVDRGKAVRGSPGLEVRETEASGLNLMDYAISKERTGGTTIPRREDPMEEATHSSSLA